MVRNDSNELCILSRTGVTATVETSIVRFIGFYPTKTHLECRNYYAEKTIISKMLLYCSNFDFEFTYRIFYIDQSCTVSLSITQKSKQTANESHSHALLFYFYKHKCITKLHCTIVCTIDRYVHACFR